uniref:THAP domain-containing protein 1 n=1 Tax=Cacopsylla melanoneura TaxID=428564 RepID=A0A8D8WRZ8_9HEMI
MVNCCKCGVVYNIQAKDKGITFHKFPTAKKKDLRVKWLAFANLTETTLKNQRLCSQHFHPSDFYHFDANSQRLLDNAVPKEPTQMDQLPEIETEEYEGNPTISGEYSSVTAITTSIVTSCSVLGCSNRAGRNNGISFFRFPNDKTILKKWLAAMRRRNWKPTPNSRLCSAHFTPDSYVTSGWSSLQRLAEDAVPSIFFFNVPVDAQIPPGVIELSIPAQSKEIVRKNNRIHEFEEINDFDGDEGIEEEEAVCMSEEENMEKGH